MSIKIILYVSGGDIIEVLFELSEKASVVDIWLLVFVIISCNGNMSCSCCLQVKASDELAKLRIIHLFLPIAKT